MFAKYTKLIVRDPSTGSLVQMLPEVKTATEVDADSSLPVSSSAVASWGEAFVRKGSESETISGDVTFEGRTTYSDDIAMSGNKIVDPSGIELSPSSSTDNNGGYIDFRYNNAEESTSRIIESASGTVTINNVNISNGSVSATTFTGALNGNAATTTKLATARTINGASFDGTGNITTTSWGTARNISISDSDDTNTGAAVSVNGSGNVTLKLPATIKASITGNVSGSSGSCTGNAATATKLATTRAINGTNFDGSAAITTANWGTARNIYVSDSDGTNTGTAVSVNGSGNATLKLPATIKASITGNCSGSSGSCTGNAATATKATQDSAGQQINTTYIKALSVSGKTITYTKGNGTTGTITTQDTNTTYSAATQSAAGLMSAADKKKLDGVASGANAYTHPTGAGNNHVPSGGSSGQFLGWSSAGAAKWVNNPNTNTTYSNFTYATKTAAGAAGLVPAPPRGLQAYEENLGTIYRKHVLTSAGWETDYTTHWWDSDKRLKRDFANVSDKFLDAWNDVNWCQFRFKKQVEEYKDKALIYVGLVVQDIRAIFEKYDVNNLYDLTLHELHDSEPEQRDDDGNLILEAQPAVDEWKLNYIHALCVEAAYQRRRASRAEARIAELEERLAKLEAALLK